MQPRNKYMKTLFGAAATAALILGISTAAAQEIKKGGTLNLVVQPEPPTVNLGANSLGPTSFVGSKIYEGLITLSPELEPIPRLAESWTISPDGKTYTFNLRKNVKWHDGKPFVADDVVFTFTKYLPATKARNKMVMEQVETITAPDPHTVVFQLKEPYPAFMFIFEVSGGLILPKHVYEGETEYRSTPVNNTIVGTGPFKLKEWRKGSYIQLVKNPDYWEAGKPYLDNIYFHVIPDANGRSIAFESGKIDAIRAGDVENFELNRLAALPNTTLTEKGWEFLDPVVYFHMNLRNKPMDDKRFRQALAYAMDRDFVVKNIFGGFGKQVDGPFANSYAFKDASVETKYAYDPEKAKKMLDEMGLKENAQGVRLELRMLPLPYGETWQRFAEYVREQLNAVGIKANIVATDVAGWAQRMNSGDFDLAFNFVYQLGDPAIGINLTYLSTTQLNAGTAANVGGYVNPEMDKLLSEAQHTLDRTARAKQYSQVQKILSDEVPILWFHEMVMPTIYRNNVKNLITTGLGMNENFNDVWIDK